MAIFVPDKADLREKNITRGKKSHFIMIKRSIHYEDIRILNVYGPKDRALKYMKQKLINERGNRQIHSNRGFNTTLPITEKISRSKIKIKKT